MKRKSERWLKRVPKSFLLTLRRLLLSHFSFFRYCDINFIFHRGFRGCCPIGMFFLFPSNHHNSPYLTSYEGFIHFISCIIFLWYLHFLKDVNNTEVHYPCPYSYLLLKRLRNPDTIVSFFHLKIYILYNAISFECVLLSLLFLLLFLLNICLMNVETKRSKKFLVFFYCVLHLIL